jgi:hypothetical protein
VITLILASLSLGIYRQNMLLPTCVCSNFTQETLNTRYASVTATANCKGANYSVTLKTPDNVIDAYFKACPNPRGWINSIANAPEKECKVDTSDRPDFRAFAPHYCRSEEVFGTLFGVTGGLILLIVFANVDFRRKQ